MFKHPLIHRPDRQSVLSAALHPQETFAMQALQEYLAGPFRSIQGWCSPHLWQTIRPMHEFQAGRGLNRPIAEIGVHHGKFFIGLLKTKNAAKANYAFDVFDMQEFNLDHSGKGSLERFEKYLAECGIARESVQIVRTDSLALSNAEMNRIEQESGGFSFFSVDGCHLAEHTFIDVQTAMRLTAPEGVIMVDDYHNPSWPGVQEGVAKLYFSGTPRFVPLGFSCAKLFLVHVSYHDLYLEAVTKFLKDNHPETTIKKVKRFGYDSITIIPDLKAAASLPHH